MNKKIEKYVYNWQAYNTLNSLPSDHRIVTTKMKLSFPKQKKQNQEEGIRTGLFWKTKK